MGSADFVDDPVACYLAEIATVPPLGSEDEAFLVRLFREGGSGSERAGRGLVEASLAAVVSVSQRYCDQGADEGIYLLDIIASGNVALEDALKRFPGSEGERFWDYAAPRVEAAVREAVGQ